MVKRIYIPERGDIVWVNFSPAKGHEQGGRRPGVILSPLSYNAKSGMCLLSPLTRKRKRYSFEVEMEGGVVLSDHLRTIDWKARKPTKNGTMSSTALREIQDNIQALILGD